MKGVCGAFFESRVPSKTNSGYPKDFFLGVAFKLFNEIDIGESLRSRGFLTSETRATHPRFSITVAPRHPVPY